MNIGLIEPSPELVAGVDTKTTHLGLLYIAAVLRQAGHKVNVLDIKVSSQDEIEGFFAKDFGAIGISVTSASFSCALPIIKRIKEARPHIPIVVGGPHVTVWGEDILNYPGIDYGICGEGEITASELFGLLEKTPNPSEQELSQIKGLFYRNNEKKCFSGMRELIKDVNSIPFPALDLVPLERYSSFGIITSRGCPFQCAYCSTPLIWNGKWRARSADNIVREVEMLVQKGARKLVYINDDNFSLDIKRANQICDLLIEKKLGLNFSSMGIRADRVDLPLLKKMYKAGIVSLSVGVESANPEVLKAIKKGETLADIERGIKLAKKAGMRIIGLFMIGNPLDTLLTVKETLKFAVKGYFDEVIFAFALPYPKTALWEYVKEHGRWLENNYSGFSHFSGKPVFDTPEFPLFDRLKAYKLAQECVLKVRSRSYLVSLLKPSFLKKVFSKRLFSKECIKRPINFLRIFLSNGRLD